MKILHTADWHIGVKTDGRDRLKEQREVLKEIGDIAEREDVDIVIIAGDVFHNSVPTSDAENLFIDTIEKLSNNGNRVVVVLAGNHDDPKRLVATEHFAKKHNIVLVGDISFHSTGFLKDKKLYISESGDGYIKVRKGDEETVIGLLPFPIDYRLSVKSDADSYSLKVKEWANICAKNFSKNTFNIFASHLMVSSAICNFDRNTDDYFASRVGDIISCEKNVLPKADYIALGHVHVPQFVGKSKNMYYPGSIIRMQYESLDRSVAIIEGDQKGLKSHKIINLTTPRKMDKVKVTSIDEIDEKLSKYSEDDIVELTFVQDEPVSSLFIRELREKYPCLSKICFEKLTQVKDDEEFVVNRRSLSYQDLFAKFYEKKTGKKASEELTKLFLEIMEEDDETN